MINRKCSKNLAFLYVINEVVVDKLKKTSSSNKLHKEYTLGDKTGIFSAVRSWRNKQDTVTEIVGIEWPFNEYVHPV